MGAGTGLFAQSGMLKIMQVEDYQHGTRPFKTPSTHSKYLLISFQFLTYLDDREQ